MRTYLGYSALCLPESLANSSKVITLDIQEDTNKVPRSYVEKTEYAGHDEFLLGFGTDIIPNLSETFDLSCRSTQQAELLELLRSKSSTKSVLAASSSPTTSYAAARCSRGMKAKTPKPLHDYNQKIFADDRVENVLFPIRDGLMIARKK